MAHKILFNQGVLLYRGHMTKDDPLTEIGGEPLDGSGFESETPDTTYTDEELPAKR
jgi:hypothetical protein